MTAQESVRAALRDAERRGLIASWLESDGRIRAVPRSGPPQICRSVRDVERVVYAARRRAVAK